ncbi:hypothetical protein [Bdellovibrio sp. HCB337]|uniref:hypothetical protein n=1 Tax=Bdellovibrio sp. HCB337 TaxID=3394358 RepID=UPI0039A75674
MEAGTRYALSKNLNFHLILSWPKNSAPADPWMRLCADSARLSKALSGAKAGPYIRVLSIGPKECPHIHFLVNEASLAKVICAFNKKCPRVGRKIFEEKTYEVKELLGYFYDRNFLPSFNDPSRPKGIRLLSASKPMRCGFPSYKSERDLLEKS